MPSEDPWGLKDIRSEALDALEAAADEYELGAWQYHYLGRRGRLTRVLEALTLEERETVGEQANHLKWELETALALEAAVLEAALEEKRETVGAQTNRLKWELEEKRSRLAETAAEGGGIMDSKIEITPCREDFAKTDEDKKRIRIQGAGFDFTVSKDPHGRSSCGCMQRMLAVELGPYRFYKCRKCGAKIVVRYDTGITVEADIQGVTADDVAKLIDAVMAKHWEGDQDEGSEEDDPTIPPVDDYSHKIYHRMVAEVNKQMRELLGHCP